MPDPLATLHRFTLTACEMLMADVAEEEMALQPSPGVNPPAWIVGHLALVNDMALGLLGQAPTLPADQREAWRAEFGPGSTPEPLAEAYPSKESLMSALRASHAALLEAIDGLDLSTVDGPNPIEFLAPHLPTRGDLLGHILTVHAGMHLGHLSNWRRQTGRPPLF